MNQATISEHLKAIFLGIFGMIRSLETIPENLLESFSDWNRSRSWLWIWFTAPFWIANLALLITAGFLAVRSENNLIGSTMMQVSKRIAQEDLVSVAFEEHYIRNRIKQRESVDTLSSNAAEGDGVLAKRPKIVLNDEFLNSDKFRESEVLLKRAYHVSPDSIQAKYQLALLSSLDKRLDDPQKTADELMLDLAKSESEPFAPAHAWLATSMIGRKERLNPTEKNELESYLKEASKWKSIEPELLSIYSTLCFQEKNYDQALRIAKQAAENSPELNLLYAQLCKEMGPKLQTEFNRAIKAAEKVYLGKINKPGETDNDRLNLARILMLQDQRDRAIEILQQGITADPKAHISIRRGLADLYVDRFREQNAEAIRKAQQVAASGNAQPEDTSFANTYAATDEVKEEINWTNLQEAARSEPDYPIVGEEIAIHWRKLATPPSDLIEVLKAQLNNDTATLGSRLVIAELYLMKGRTAEAKQQWEIILKKNPNVINALNNLAITISREQPPQLGRAIELIERGYRMDPLNAEMCDTYGEVYMNAGRPVDAISKFEEAVRIDPARIDSRLKIAACYRQLGMVDMAEQQESHVKMLEEAKAERKEAERLKRLEEDRNRAREIANQSPVITPSPTPTSDEAKSPNGESKSSAESKTPGNPKKPSAEVKQPAAGNPKGSSSGKTDPKAKSVPKAGTPKKSP